MRRRFPEAQITLLNDSNNREGWVAAPQLLTGARVVDAFHRMTVGSNGRVSILSSMIALAKMFRENRGRFDAVLDLGPYRPMGIGALRMLFFRIAGRRYYGSSERKLREDADTGLTEFEASRLDRIARQLTGTASDLTTAEVWNLQLGAPEREEFTRAFRLATKNKIRAAVCCSAKVSTKRWPFERYAAALQALDRQMPLEVLIFGGESDRVVGEEVARKLRSAHNLCGKLSPRGSAFGISTCDFYLGNDTGPMHLAAAAGLPCVALFSARDLPGKWWPVGDQHKIIWKAVSCGGCWLNNCIHEGLRCLRDISVEQVVDASLAVIRKQAFNGGSRGAPIYRLGGRDRIWENREFLASIVFRRETTFTSPKINIIGSSAFSSTGGIQAMNRLLVRELGSVDALRRAFFLWDDESLVEGNGFRAKARGWASFYGRNYNKFLIDLAQQSLRHQNDLWLCTHVNYLFLGMLLSHGRTKRLGVMLHGVELDDALTPSKKFALRRANFIIAVSEYTKKKALKLGVDPLRVHVVHNGTDDPCPEWTLCVRQCSGPTVLFVGRMDEFYKGQMELLDAMALLQRRMLHLKLVFVGEGRALNEWKEEARRRGLAEIVEFTGRVTDDQLRRRYADATIFAMPSENEGFGLVYAEAMAHGVPCIGSDRDAAREVICHGETGLCVPARNSTALADAISSVIREPDLHSKMANAARRRFVEKFTTASYRQRLLSALSDWRSSVS